MSIDINTSIYHDSRQHAIEHQLLPLLGEFGNVEEYDVESLADAVLVRDLTRASHPGGVWMIRSDANDYTEEDIAGFLESFRIRPLPRLVPIAVEEVQVDEAPTTQESFMQSALDQITQVLSDGLNRFADLVERMLDRDRNTPAPEAPAEEPVTPRFSHHGRVLIEVNFTGNFADDLIAGELTDADVATVADVEAIRSAIYGAPYSDGLEVTDVSFELTHLYRTDGQW